MNITVSGIKEWKQTDGWYVNPENGDRVKLGDGVTLGDWVNSEELNKQIKQIYQKQPFHLFTKWVTSARLSPNFDGGTQLKYEKGTIVEVPEAEVSDQQCGIGLHVLRYGYRPEWAGLCEANHGLIPLDVKVMSGDICFAGLPTMDIKIRVRRLEVLS